MLGTLAWAKALLRRAHHMRGGLKRFLRVTWQRAISHEQEALRVQGEIAERLLVSDLGHPAPKLDRKIQMIEVQRPGRAVAENTHPRGEVGPGHASVVDSQTRGAIYHQRLHNALRSVGNGCVRGAVWLCTVSLRSGANSWPSVHWRCSPRARFRRRISRWAPRPSCAARSPAPATVTASSSATASR